MVVIKKTIITMLMSCIFFSISFFVADESHAQHDIRLSKGQSVYVPVYSHIYFGDREARYYLAATVSIRNIDQINFITITEANYYNTQGNLIKKYLDKPVRLGPNSSTRFVVKESDDKGGSGANFIIK